MCGIAGIKLDRPVGDSVLRRMVEALHHRGPDADGYYADGPYQAGMRRLAINDLEHGDQPLFNGDRSVVLLYNGEIYNYGELRRELEAKGHRFRTRSDGEVICHLYEHHGETLFERLDGMFAAALWSVRERKLVLARDLPGEKPLYYAEPSPGGVVFASEIVALQRFPGLDLALDRQAIWDLATYHGNQSSMHDPLADHANNTLTTLKLLERVKAMRGLAKLVYASAGCTVAQKTFDAAEATQETDPVSLYLDSPYQISKIIGEFYGNYYFARHGVNFVKARFQNVYGPGEVLGAGQWRGTPATVWRNVTPTFIWKALRGEALPVDNGGIATRDFIYVDDIVEGLVACALEGRPGEVYNLASGVETSIKDLAETVNALTDNKAPIALKPARNWDRSGKRYGDPSKARAELGFTATIGLREGLRLTVEWTRRHHDMIAHAIERHAPFMREVEAG